MGGLAGVVRSLAEARAVLTGHCWSAAHDRGDARRRLGACNLTPLLSAARLGGGGSSADRRQIGCMVMPLRGP